MSDEIILSQTDGRPMYLQIVEQIKSLVAAGVWEPQRALPSIRGMAVALGISVITVKRAYLELEREGVIVTRHGKGSFVADRATEANDVGVQEIDRHLLEAIRVARRLGVEEGGLADRLLDLLKAKPKDGNG